MAGFMEAPQTTDPVELLRYFQREAQRRETPKAELPKGILERPSEEVDDESYGVMKFFADWWSGTEEKVAEARREVLEGLVNMPMPTLPQPPMPDELMDVPTAESEPIIEGVPEKPEMGSREPYELEVDTIGNEALDRNGMRLVDVTDTEQGKLSNEEALFEMGKQIREETIKTEGLMSKPSDDSADGVQPTDGKDFETRLEERLVELEGFRAKPYKPDEDEEFLTIGYGHYGSDVKKGTEITEAEARDLLRKDIKKRMPQIKKAIKNFDSLSEDLKVEIAQSWFRGGISGSPKTIKLINEGKFTEAAAEFLDNEEYRTTELGGVKTRMEALSNALKEETA